MADWTQSQAGVAAAVATLPPGGNLVVRREHPEVRMQFTVLLDGATLRAEVCNESTPEDDERLRGRGWDLVDAWSGVWRRTVALPATAAALEQAVGEAFHVVRALWGHPRPDAFGYLAWREAGDRAWWQFWKPAGDTPLTFSELGLPRAKEPDPNS